jgi:hypothetical protein
MEGTLAATINHASTNDPKMMEGRCREANFINFLLVLLIGSDRAITNRAHTVRPGANCQSILSEETFGGQFGADALIRRS